MDERESAEFGIVVFSSRHLVSDGVDSVWNATNGSHLESNTTLGHPTKAAIESILIGLVFGLIISATLFGNILVVCAVANFHRLRTTTNCFVVSLAIADILVALLVMPAGLLYEVFGYWRFGWIFCYFWISCDVTCCTASIMHLCIISLDRYWAITQPLTYKSKMTRQRACLMIGIVWVCSISISFVPIYLGWFADTNTKLYTDTPECGLSVNRVYAVISATTSFYAPLVVMLFTYMKIFTIAQKQANEIRKMESSMGHLKLSTTSNNRRMEKRSQRISRDNKAIKTLGILMGLFCFCWVPFFVMYVVMPFCDACVLSERVLAAITWLGYVNSCINPCVYAYLNRDFRTAFKKILCCIRCCVSCRRQCTNPCRDRNRRGSDVRSSLVIENHRKPRSAERVCAYILNGNRKPSIELHPIEGAGGRMASGCRSSSLSSSSEYKTHPLIARVQ